MRIKIIKDSEATRGLHHMREGTEHTVAEAHGTFYIVDGDYKIPKKTAVVIDGNPHRVTVKHIVAGARYEWAEATFLAVGGNKVADLADLDKQGWEIVSSRDGEGTWVTYTIRRALPNPEQISAKIHAKQLASLDDKSLDYIVEVIGEGDDFATFNKGKSAMRHWFLSHLRELWNLPEPPAKDEEPPALG